MATSDFIQKAYIAFFNRPADKSGFDHWLNYPGANQDLLNLFAKSEEYLSDFAGKTYRKAIEIIYHNLFGRDPEKEGWDYWEAQMEAGWVTVGNAAYEILGGAKGTDFSTISNKTTAAQNFTNALNTTAKANAYAQAGNNGVGHLAKEWLATVSHDNLTTAQANMNSILTTLLGANTPKPDEGNTLFIEPSYDYTIEFSTDRNNYDGYVAKWVGGFGNGTVTVSNFNELDRLDFTAYGAKWLGAAQLEQMDWAAYENGSSNWMADSAFPRTGLDIGDKYITLTNSWYLPSWDHTYKIELWTQRGDYAGAYYRRDGIQYTNKDTAQLIGYIDLGCKIDLDIVHCIDF